MVDFPQSSAFDENLINHGVIEHHPNKAQLQAAARRTIIVSGLGRSGTSMIAAVLLQAGVHLGEFLAETVHEDRELLDVLGRGDRPGLRRAIRDRDVMHDVWGFKLPNLHRYMHHGDVALFRNARLVIALRDIVAVAVRHAIAEHCEAFDALSDIADGTVSLMHFARLAGCPVLMVSYEKALAFPDTTLARIEAFCGLSVNATTRARMLDCISPNNLDYATQARRTYEGFIERVDAEGRLIGWCRQAGQIEPVRLELLAEDVPTEQFTACLPRDDLLEAGLGNGNHGFAQPLPTYTLPPTVKLRVRVAGTTWELPGGNRGIDELSRMPDSATASPPLADPVPAEPVQPAVESAGGRTAWPKARRGDKFRPETKTATGIRVR